MSKQQQHTPAGLGAIIHSPIVEELRTWSSGRYLWRVHDKDTRSWCMEWPDWQKPEAEKWWAENKSKHPEYFANHELERVLHQDIGDLIGQAAADMLEFFFGQMQIHSPQMDGQHSYRFRSGGWPMTHCKGPSAEDAVRAAIKEIKRSREEMKCIKSFDCNAGDHSDACGKSVGSLPPINESGPIYPGM